MAFLAVVIEDIQEEVRVCVLESHVTAGDAMESFPEFSGVMMNTEKLHHEDCVASAEGGRECRTVDKTCRDGRGVRVAAPRRQGGEPWGCWPNSPPFPGKWLSK